MSRPLTQKVVFAEGLRRADRIEGAVHVDGAAANLIADLLDPPSQNHAFYFDTLPKLRPSGGTLRIQLFTAKPLVFGDSYGFVRNAC